MEELQEKDDLFEQNISLLKMKYAFGKVPKLNSIERNILEFCHERDMKEFLKEEFEKHPIVLNENGELIGSNPFAPENINLK